MELILTLDVGTTSVKACLFDRQLRQTALTSREYALQTRGVCAEAPNRMLLSHPSTPPATARIAIRKHPRMILFFIVCILLFPNL